MIPVLYYNYIERGGINAQIRKIVDYLQRGSFKSAYVGNSEHIKKMIELGGTIDSVDNTQRTAFEIALSKALMHQKFSMNRFSAVYALLRPEALSLKCDNQLIKIDAHKSEFFFLMLVMTLLKTKRFFYHGALFVFKAEDIASVYDRFSESIIPDYRKKKAYISALLARNEVHSTYTSNRKLFIRIQRGFYRMNPDLALKTNDIWASLEQS